MLVIKDFERLQSKGKLENFPADWKNYGASKVACAL